MTKNLKMLECQLFTDESEAWEYHPYSAFCNKVPFHMYIDIYVDSDDETLKALYKKSANNHNLKIFNNPEQYDAGFDMYLPNEIVCDDKTEYTKSINHQIKCRAKIINLGICNERMTAFYTYARSSITNKCLRLGNNQGIIDAGYRGDLIGKFDVLHRDDATMSYVKFQKYSRLLQICAPGLVPIYVNIVNSLEELGCETTRGTGGFGSTGV